VTLATVTNGAIGALTTVTAAEPTTPLIVATIRVDPTAVPRTSPLASTVATELSSTDHVTALAASMPPVSFNAVAVAVPELPRVSSSGDMATTTRAGTGIVGQSHGDVFPFFAESATRGLTAESHPSTENITAKAAAVHLKWVIIDPVFG